MTPRDEKLLRALARFGAARTPDLVRLLFAEVREDTAARRLRKLFDGGLLEVRAGDRSEANVYTLGPEGKRWARDRGLPLARVPRGDLDHHLTLVAVWTGLASACHQGSVRLSRFVPDWDLRSRDPGALLVPDALVELRTGSGLVQFALEIDLGSERAAEWRRKLERYAASLHPGAALGLVVLFEGGGRRGALLEDLLRAWASWRLVAPISDGARLLTRVVAVATPYALPLPQWQPEARK